jgi:riboflavin synthase
MFTGIVQGVGKVRAAERNAQGLRLVIDRTGWMPSSVTLAHGDSVCISGVCLTLVQFDAVTMTFDVISETLAKTNLGGLAVGSRVNLEPSMTASTQIGGHVMQGHVDGTGTVTAIKAASDDYRITVKPGAAIQDFIVSKGSIAIDGVSLTIASVDELAGTFDVALIPTTLALTTLRDRKAGDTVNLEADILAKTVVAYLKRHLSKDARGNGPTYSQR